MNEISIQSIIDERYPHFFRNKPSFFKRSVIKTLDKILYINEINRVIKKNEGLKNFEFIEEVFEYLNFSFKISNKDIKRIPSEGRLIVVANHPIGSLDSLAILKAISEIRTDVKIVANDILTKFENINDLLLPYNIESIKMQRANISTIQSALDEEMAVIIFPAAEVSRLKLLTVRESKWHKGAVYFAKKFNSPILPVFINAKNSILFYTVSAINKAVSTVLLAHELFNKKNKTIEIKIGDPIPAKAFSNNYLNAQTQIKLLKKHVYSLHKGKGNIFITEKNVIHPIDRKAIKRELASAEHIGKTRDDKKIILTDINESPNVLYEIARLREITFRKVGEGTGKKRDFDNFDKYYKHLVVWDESELEIVGSYRIGICKDILKSEGSKGLYTTTLFEFSKKFENEIRNDSIELGRSFVQRRYWNTNALNYLWQGIGAFLAKNDWVRYMYGGVSISNNYSENARSLIVFYFDKWFGDYEKLALSKNRYLLTDTMKNEFVNLFTGINYKEDYRILKNVLRPTGFTVPILYKHYSELCNEGGVKFLDFGVDPDFENCIDGLILVDVEKIKDEKRERFIGSLN